MNKRICAISLIVILFQFILDSCGYNPTGENYVEVKYKEPVLAVQLDMNKDTVVVWEDAKLNYKIDPLQINIEDISFFIDNNLLEKVSTTSGSISFNSESFIYGYHKLKLQVISNSGTGSVADRLGAEKAIFIKEWTLLIDNYTPGPLGITFLGPSEGALKVQWEKYTHSNFRFYDVYKNGYLYSTIYNRDINFFIDSLFKGGSVRYSVNISTGKLGSGPEKSYSDSNKILTEFIRDSNKVRISWDKNKFYKNFSNYIIYRNDNIAAIETDINNTTYTDNNPPFGQSYKYGIAAKERAFGTTGSKTEGVDIHIGEEYPVFRPNCFVKASNSFYSLTNSVVYRMDGSNLHIIASSGSFQNEFEWNYFSVSPGGNLVYVSAGDKLYKLNPVSLAVEKEISIPAITGIQSNISSGFQVTDSNVVVFTSWLRESSSTHVLQNSFIINLNNNKIINSIPRSSSGDRCALANNGHYFYTGGILYKLSGGNLTQIGREGMPVFIGDGGRYFVSSNNLTALKNSNDMSTISSIKASNGFSYDEATGFVGILQPGNIPYYIIYEPSTWKQITKINVFEVSFSLANSILFSPGYYLPLSLEK